MSPQKSVPLESSSVTELPRGTFWQSFGPGLIFAGTAVGVSHLVQSTRAGASMGFGLSGVILLALIFKYPFFAYGPRYAAATGMSLIEGYRRIGRWALWLYVGIMVGTGVITQSAIVLFTSFLVSYVIGFEGLITPTAAAVYGLCGFLLWRGRFRALDLAIKTMLLALALSTLFAAVLVLPRADFSSFSLAWPAAGTVSFGFLLALMGWMPSDVAAAVYTSLWSLAKDRTSGVRATVRIAKLDFFVGYMGTSILAFAFVLLGASLMFGSGIDFSPEGAVFSTQLVELYTGTFGGWIRPIILVLVLTTMFSTALTVLDGFPRVIDRGIALILVDDPALTANRDPGKIYWVAFSSFGVGVVILLTFFRGNLTTMVDLATGLAFLTGPLLGYLNLRAMTSPEVPEEHPPGKAMRAFSFTGIALLGFIAAAFVFQQAQRLLGS
jgi:Mn2+/Fe2+ NRAMP family transporter